MKKYKYILIIPFSLFIFTSIGAQQEYLIQGRTMGTTYHVKVVTGDFEGIAGLKEKIDARLVEINESMSTYKKESEISRFNDMIQAGRAF